MSQAPSVRSLCQTKSARAPSTSRATCAASSSQLDPGKRTMANRGLLTDLEPALLDHGVGEELVAHLLDALARPGGVTLVQAQLEVAPDPNVADLGETEALERALHGL